MAKPRWSGCTLRLTANECLDATDDDERRSIFITHDGNDAKALRIAKAGERVQDKIREAMR